MQQVRDEAENENGLWSPALLFEPWKTTGAVGPSPARAGELQGTHSLK